MKITILFFALAIVSCNNSSQKQAYRDSADMYLDSMLKYQPAAVTDDSTINAYDPEEDLSRKTKYNMYKTKYDMYIEKAK